VDVMNIDPATVIVQSEQIEVTEENEETVTIPFIVADLQVR
jgi:hypothetical protein